MLQAMPNDVARALDSERPAQKASERKREAGEHLRVGKPFGHLLLRRMKCSSCRCMMCRGIFAVHGLTRQGMSEFEFFCDRISHTFTNRGGSVRAIDGITLSARVGEFLCIVGPSGCGKSTLLRIIADLLVPTEGAMIYGRAAEDGRHRTGLVFQDHGVFPWMTVLDNVALGLELQGVPRAEREERARKFISQAGLHEFESSYPNELSVGMRQ